MISSITLEHLRNGEFSQFLIDILMVVQQNDPTSLNVLNEYNNLRAVSDNIEKLFKVPTGSIITTELEVLDRRRDNAFNGINALINGYAYSTDVTAKQNAALLSNHLAVFGSVTRDNLQSETASIRNILTDWDTQPDLTAAYTGLGLQSWRDELEDANNSFNKRYVDRGSGMGTNSPDTITSIRTQAYHVYYELRDLLDAWFRINKGADPFGKTARSINGMIDNYKGLLDRRTGGIDEPLPPVSATNA